MVTAELRKLAIASDSYTVYVEPKLVVRIAPSDIQRALITPAGSLCALPGQALPHGQEGRYRYDRYRPRPTNDAKQRGLKLRRRRRSPTGSVCRATPAGCDARARRSVTSHAHLMEIVIIEADSPKPGQGLQAHGLSFRAQG